MVPGFVTSGAFSFSMQCLVTFAITTWLCEFESMLYDMIPIAMLSQITDLCCQAESIHGLHLQLVSQHTFGDLGFFILCTLLSTLL